MACYRKSKIPESVLYERQRSIKSFAVSVFKSHNYSEKRVSRGAYDSQIFTDDREKLRAALGHNVSHSSAHAPKMKPE